jgi:stringent starvation protein B
VEPKDKRQAIEEMLAKGDTMICLDSRYPGVIVPEQHQGNPDLRLVLNLNFRGSITPLPEGIQAELLFSGVPFLCWIPYDSLWAVYNPQTGEGYLWPGQVPESLRDLLGGKKEGAESKSEVKRLGPPALPKKAAPKPKSPATRSPKEGTRRPKIALASKPDKSDRGNRSKFRLIPGGKKD